MTLKQYRRASIAVLAATGAVCGVAVNLKSYYLFVAAVLVAVLVQLMLRRRTDGVTLDERDLEIGGKAAYVAMQVFALAALGGAFVLFVLRDLNPLYGPVAATLTFSACALMIVYGLISGYLGRYMFGRRRAVFFVFAALLIAALILFGIRLFSGEDDWICQNGKWVMHGHPSFSAPAKPCG